MPEISYICFSISLTVSTEYKPVWPYSLISSFKFMTKSSSNVLPSWLINFCNYSFTSTFAGSLVFPAGMYTTCNWSMARSFLQNCLHKTYSRMSIFYELTKQRNSKSWLSFDFSRIEPSLLLVNIKSTWDKCKQILFLKKPSLRSLKRDTSLTNFFPSFTFSNLPNISWRPYLRLAVLKIFMEAPL